MFKKLNTKKEIVQFFDDLFFKNKIVKSWVVNYYNNNVKNENIIEIFMTFLYITKKINIESKKWDEIIKLFEDFFVFGKDRKEFFEWYIENRDYFLFFSEVDKNSNENKIIQKEIEFWDGMAEIERKYLGVDDDVYEIQYRNEIYNWKKEYKDIDFEKLYEGNKITNSDLIKNLNTLK